MGIWPASNVKVRIYLYDENGSLLDQDYCSIYKPKLRPEDSSTWELMWFDNKMANRVDKSRTQYRLDWSEYTGDILHDQVEKEER